jgi:hypothetical protein
MYVVTSSARQAAQDPKIGDSDAKAALPREALRVVAGCREIARETPFTAIISDARAGDEI